MKSITEQTEEQLVVLNTNYKELKEKLGSGPHGTSFNKQELFANYTHTSGYAHYKFSGKALPIIAEKLGRAPTATDIIMIVDDGFSHFGASCSLNPNTGEFSGRVNTD